MQSLPHAAFDVLAYLLAGLTLIWVEKRLPPSPVSSNRKWDYLAALLVGAVLGAYLFGTLNLRLSDHPGIGRSIEGALAGAIFGVEIYKRMTGVSGSTGARFALPFAVGVAVGRIGCFFSGTDDFTYGTPTTLIIGHDFGDGILRHPVQLYESASMIIFVVLYLIALATKDRWFIANGFYLVVGYYGLQRFIIEFLKPYGHIYNQFTIFHLLSLALVAYAAFMLIRSTNDQTGSVNA